jgi:predicted nucleic acid-binding protein
MSTTADSSVWIDFLKGRNSAQVKLLEALLNDSSRDLILLDVVLMEVLRGIRDEYEYQNTYEALMPFVVTTAGGKSIALASVKIYRSLRKKGLTVRSSVDLLVAAWCIQNDCDLIHSDRDFDAIASEYPLRVWS